MSVLTQEQLQNVLDQAMREITNRITSIQPCERESVHSGDICTVHTALVGGQTAALVLCADTALLTRLAQHVMRTETVEQRDIEDVATEYFNIICGRVVAGLFQAAHISSRFHIPKFQCGRYRPEHTPSCQCVLNYISGNDEGVQLIYSIPSLTGEIQ